MFYWHGFVADCARSKWLPFSCSQKVGCDKVMDSGTVSDRCGVCGGDGSTCMAVKGQDMNTYNQEGITAEAVASM